MTADRLHAVLVRPLMRGRPVPTCGRPSRASQVLCGQVDENSQRSTVASPLLGTHHSLERAAGLMQRTSTQTVRRHARRPACKLN
jgi:hypothetical protein